MDWDLKMPYWGDLEELDETDEPPSFNLSATASSSNNNQGDPNCSVDLKLGGLGEFGQPERWKEQGKLPMPPAPAKRARTPADGVQAAACLVDGCKSDLSKCRDYHRRHKVCEVHSKTQMVIVGGQEQRFCQQCSRFHLLLEFDEVKRSCRKRLNGHNQRRRKPQLDPSRSAGLFSTPQGPRFTSYPPQYPAALTDSNWGGIIKAEEDTYFTHVSPIQISGTPATAAARPQSFPRSFSISFKDGKKFPFPQDGNAAAGYPPSLKAIPCSESSGRNNMKIFAEGIPQAFSSDCALSLLSSPTQNTVVMNPSHTVPSGRNLASNLPFGGPGQFSCSQTSGGNPPMGISCSGMTDEHSGSGGPTILFSDGSDADLNCQSFFHVVGEGAAEGTSHALPFSWQ